MGLQGKNRRNYGTSKFKGVYFNKQCNKWQAQATVNGKKTYLGIYDSEKAAAAAAAPYFMH